MTNYYLDTEETGLNIEKDKIITIQYQKLDCEMNPISELVILKEWESSEEDIIKKFHKTLFEQDKWNFVPVMYNHIFDFSFLFSKFKKYGLSCPDLADYFFEKPKLDIKDSLIIANNFNFKGSSLNGMTNKKREGEIIPPLYYDKKFKEIEDYIINETKSFIEALKLIKKRLKGFALEIKNGIPSSAD